MNTDSEYGPKVPMLFGAHYLAKTKKETSGTSSSPQLSRSGPAEEPGKTPHHTDKWRSCIDDVQAQIDAGKLPSGSSAYAICTAQLGPSIEAKKKESKKNGHSTRASANSKLRESGAKSMRSRGSFVEAIGTESQGSGRRFRVVLLQEGMGNMEDCFYYTKKAIQSAVPIFEGAQFYVNHPAQSEETDRPERDVREIAGYFEKLSTQVAQDGRTQLAGDLVLLAGNAFDRERSLMVESIEYAQKHPGKDLVGLSINANGDFEEANLQNFMQMEDIPPGAMEKLNEALQRGITTIRPVNEMTSAVSCDLVTVAGAGGRINQLLEGRKNMEDETKKESEKSKEEEKAKEAAKHEGEDGKDQSADPEGGHPDASQDEELILNLMKKYLGDGFSDEDKAMATEAVKHAKSMFPGDESEAMKCAGYNLKMAKHMQKSAKPADGQPAPQEKGLDGALDVHSPDPVHGGGGPATKLGHSESDKKASTLVESYKKEIVRLTGENARLKSDLEKERLEKFIDKTLRESKLPMSATKKFRETIKSARTEKEVTEKLAIFKEGFSLAGESESGFYIEPEKTMNAGGEAGLSFKDCVEE